MKHAFALLLYSLIVFSSIECMQNKWTEKAVYGLQCFKKGVYKTACEPSTGIALCFAGILSFNHYTNSCDSITQSIMTSIPFVGFGTGTSIIKNGLPERHLPKNLFIKTFLEHPFTLYIFGIYALDYLLSKNEPNSSDNVSLAIAGISAGYLGIRGALNYWNKMINPILR